eukprot:CAMPEP_0113548626 /NCGR_PEP_ID=MMETSP0015_2-20120614/12993_1 /TAXON_ID=2838 /ORGANISM="Odontella" /LENGTH=543 /DNA_ID=CAMNT_0000449267 /DNA_START=220 /DNA_END=1851 /DNA_ORIENTATION=+ /assembly_acc=CAM_ASM_000160
MLRALSPKSSRSVVTDAATAFPDSHRIYQDVAEASKRYEDSRAKLLLLIASLKKQHSSMMKTSMKRLETAKQFESLLVDTPLSKMVSEVGTAEAKTKVFAHTPPVTPEAVEKKIGPSMSTPLQEDDDEHVNSDDSENVDDGDEGASFSSASDAPVKPADSDEAAETEDGVKTGCGDEGGDEIASPVATDGGAAEKESKEELGEKDAAKEGLGEEEKVAKEGLGEEEKVELVEEGENEESVPKPVESDEELAKRLAMEWAEEAEEWKGPPQAESRDDAIIQPCDTAETESTHSHDSGSLVPQSGAARTDKDPVPQSIGEEDELPTQRQSHQPLIIEGSDFDEVHHSYGAVHEASHKLTLLYLDQYSSSIIKYVEEWDQVVSTRIHGRLLEFEKQKLKLEHYVQKVDSLRTGIQKRETRNKQVSPKASQRFDRNELKLGGAREAYESYGESLLLLLEEITIRAWRDCLPLLMRVMEYDINHSKDQAKIFSTLNKTVEILETLGTGREVDPNGRIQALKEWKPEEIYTGGKHVVPPVHSTRDVYEV